jgi:hypothetical protein
MLGADRPRSVMEVRLGVVYSHKELSVEVDGEPADVQGRIEQALRDGTPVLWIDDTKGQRVGVPVDKLAYVEIVGDDGRSQVGFGKA